MSTQYHPIPTTESAPPAYESSSSPRTSIDEDNIPDDFKYGTNVRSCELSIRQLFIRKVYSLLTAQLILSVSVGFLLNKNDTIRTFATTHVWPVIVSMVGAIGFMIAAHFKSREYPYNLMLLGGFTLCESYLVGVATVAFDGNTVINAVLLTTVIFIGLTLFAFQTKYDFTGLQGILFYVLLSMVSFGFLSMFLSFSSTVDYIYSIIGALVFSIFVLVDTQLIMSRYHPEEEVSAAITLYLDILNLFLYILRIMSHNDDN